jgi:hypothetical protein
MNDKVYNVIAGDVVAVERIIKRESQVRDISLYKLLVELKLARPRRFKKITDIFNNRVFTYICKVIPLERDMKRIRICEESDEYNEEDMKSFIPEKTAVQS